MANGNGRKGLLRGMTEAMRKTAKPAGGGAASIAREIERLRQKPLDDSLRDIIKTKYE